MDNRRYKNIVYNHLRENKAVSLKILLEEEGEEKDDIFDMPESGSEEENQAGDDDVAGEDSSSEEENQDGDDPNTEDSSGLKAQLVANLSDMITNLGHARAIGVSSVAENKTYYEKFSEFLLFEETDTPEKLIDDLEDALNKNISIIKNAELAKAQLTSGVKLDIDLEVSKAIDKLIHFREKVDVIDLIEELFCNKIKLTAPAEDIERNINEFKEQYAEEVHRHRAKIDLPGSKHYNDESVYLDKHDGYNGAAGARSQG